MDHLEQEMAEEDSGIKTEFVRDAEEGEENLP
jgi:hypothetical protein